MRWLDDFRISIIQNQIAYLIDAECKATAHGQLDKAHAYGVLKKEKEQGLNRLLGLEDDKED